MKGKFFFQLSLILLLVGLVSGTMTDGSFQVDNGGGKVVINTGACQEDWSSSSYGACINGNQVYYCFDKNNCGTTNLIPALCGNIQSCTVQQLSSSSNGGNPSPGGGTPVTTSTTGAPCSENWQCVDWSICSGGTQTRTCTDTNKCGTTLNRPALSQSCKLTTQKSTNFLTGAAIGKFAKSGAGIATFITLIVVVVLGISFIAIKKNKLAKKSSEAEVKKE